MNRKRNHVPFGGQTFVYLAVFGLLVLRFLTGMKPDLAGEYREVSAAPEKETEVLCSEEQEKGEHIRVRISDGSGSFALKDVKGMPLGAYRVKTAEKEYVLPANNAFSFSSWMRENRISQCSLYPVNAADGISLLSVTKADIHPVYPNRLDIFYSAKENGFYLVNEVEMEAYLPGVVGSEMLRDFPLEAKKAQAVCARSFAGCAASEEGHTMEVSGFDGIMQTVRWNLEDTVADQVYIPGHETQTAQEACAQTRGICLYRGDSIEKPHFYSTSWGEAADGRVFENLGDEAVEAGAVPVVSDCSAAFVRKLARKAQTSDYDRNSPWYRWEGRLSLADEGLLGIKEIQVTKRGEGEAVTQLLILNRDGSGRIVSGASQIRHFLGSKDTLYRLSDGRIREGLSILPSPFFAVESVIRNQDGTICSVLLRGGGFGHGYGMSQYGAAQMAEDGMDFREILGYYFPEMELMEGKE